MKVFDGLQIAPRNCSALSCSVRGLVTAGSVANSTWQNGLLWSYKLGAVVVGGRLDVRKSILGSFGAGSFAFVFKVTCLLTSDYNNVVIQRGGYAGASVVPNGFLGGTSRYDTIAAWVQNVGLDRNTLTFDPLFANPAHVLERARTRPSDCHGKPPLPRRHGIG